MPEPVDKKLERLDKLEKIVELLNDGVSKKEFLKNFEIVIEMVKSAGAKNLETLNQALFELKEHNAAAAQKFQSDTDLTRSELKAMCKEHMDSMMAEFQTRMAQMDEKMANVRDGKDADEKAIVEAVKAQIQPLIPSPFVLDPITVRDQLESLEAEDRPKWIPDIEKVLSEHDERIKRLASRPLPPGVSADAVLSYDLSSQCDGSTTTFTVPRHRQALLLIGTQFPNVYRPTTDFTTANLRLSLVTSQVSAPASGQTLIFLYRK